MEPIINNLKETIASLINIQDASFRTITTLKDLLIEFQTKIYQHMHPNPLNQFGLKCFSQSDEDGITIEILQRLKIKKGVYAEIGVGNGLENNTLILVAMGWKGFWVGNEDLAFSYSPSSKFNYFKTWLTKDNVLDVIQSGMNSIDEREIDVISIDVDGNDIYLANQLLINGIRPKIFIIEYNGQFVPPTKFQIEYNQLHVWQGDNFYGAALSNLDELFRLYDYRLICCNSQSGVNAFFIKNEYNELFLDVPNDIRKIYSPPRYNLLDKYGHKQSHKTIEKIFQDLNKI